MRSRPNAWSSGWFWPFGLRLAGAGLLAATGVIHLDLYLTGYRSIPTIGWLFLLQMNAVLAVAAAVLVTGSRLIAAAGAALALATLAAYLRSVWAGLFGFTEVRSTPGIVAGVIEVAAFAALTIFAAGRAGPGRHGEPAAGGSRVLAKVRVGVPGAGRAVVGISVAALTVLGISVARAGGPATARDAGRAVLRTARIGGVTVLTDASGFTLYWFTRDTPTRSNCYGTCAGYWPPLQGAVSAAPGIPGELATMKRSDGTAQVTYNGHPLYTYIGDTAPGEAFGNNLQINGGLWHEMTVPGAVPGMQLRFPRRRGARRGRGGRPVLRRAGRRRGWPD